MECVGRIKTCLNQSYSDVVGSIEEAKISFSHAVSNAFQAINDGFTALERKISNGMTLAKTESKRVINETQMKMYKLAHAITNWISENQCNLFFVACSMASIYFSPTLTLSAAFLTLVARVEITKVVKSIANDYLKSEKNPYRTHPKFDTISQIDLGIGGLSGLTALGLSTIFSTNYLAVTLLPLLGGAALGNSMAKMIMNWVDGTPVPTLNSSK